MYLDEHGNKLGGADVKFIVEDEQGKPRLAVTKAEEADPAGPCQYVHRRTSGLDRLRARTGEHREKMVYLSSVAAADDLTQRQLDKYPYFVRTGWTSSQPIHPLGQWACDQGYKKIVTIAADYAFGYETVGGFQKSVRGLRRQDHPEDVAAARHQGLRPLTFRRSRQDADAIFTVMVGPMSLQFPKQLRGAGNQEAGASAAAPATTNSSLPAMGDEVDRRRFARCSTARRSTRRPTRPSSRRTGRNTARFPAIISESNYTTAHVDRRGDEEDRRQMAGTAKSSSRSCRASRSMRRAGR